MQKYKTKKVVQNLNSEKLRKIRYELRTLLRLEKEKRWKHLHDRYVAFSKDDSFSYDECVKKQDFTLRKQEELDLDYIRYPLCCIICGDRMENLIFNPVMYQWCCVPCYEGAHERFPEEYP